MEIINRYIYAVVKQFPKKDKEEIEKTIKGLIHNMIESYEENMTEEEKAKKAIETLGNPNQLANRYRKKERYLIGPKYFDKYLAVLKVVLYSICLGVTVASFIEIIVSHEAMLPTFIHFTQSIFSALLQGTVWVTVIFAIFEYKDVNLENEVPWSIKDLPQMPQEKALISRSESIFTILFSTLFFSCLYFASDIIAIYYVRNFVWSTIPIFNIHTLNSSKLLILCIFLATLLQESLKMIWGQWTPKRAIVYSVISVLSCSLNIMFFANISIWNKQIFDSIYKYTQLNPLSFINLMSIIIVLITGIEITTALYKGFKYGN